jgi:chorismate mutase/prephenate dehydratase
VTDLPDLARLRGDLDDIDRGLVELIARRLDTVAAVGKAKADAAAPVRDVERERAVLASVESAARQRGISGDLVRRVFREIIGHAVDRQAADLASTVPQTVTVRYPGAAHSYSHLAALKHFAGRSETATYTGGGSYAEVVTAMEQRRCDFAVLPIEDTSAGSINQVYDLLQRRDVAVVGEETWRIDLCVAATAEVPLGALTHILSDQSGLDQCAAFLGALPGVEPVRYGDADEAMRAVAERADPAYAAIGSPEAADGHGLVVLRQGVGDRDESYARFVVLAARPVDVDPRVPSKTSLVLTTRHEEGALLRCLEILAGSGHSLTKLESRPQPGRPFEYLFFVDFEGNMNDPRTQLVIDELRGATLYVKVPRS